ncbi:MAG: hypothetical protein HC922_08630 [Leptolyngbyaceae cyanobacterium SM2_3_12]|nr:hypothetical protein [Leptolyngbyaceae cyanobacterium SM2_3_12]
MTETQIARPPASAEKRPAAVISDSVHDPMSSEDLPTSAVEPEQVDDLFKDLKTLLSTVEKLQKSRQEIGEIKPLVLRLLDGELLAGEQLEELRSGLSSLSKLLRLYGEYQTALEKAQPARALLDDVLK